VDFLFTSELKKSIEFRHCRRHCTAPRCQERLHPSVVTVAVLMNGSDLLSGLSTSWMRGLQTRWEHPRYRCKFTVVDRATRSLCDRSSCCVSLGMGVRKVSISKSDFQGHSRVLALVPFDRPHTISTPLSGKVCHPWASTCACQPIYPIWSLYLHPLRRYERQCKMWKMGWFGVVKDHSRSLEIAPFERAHTSSY